MGGLLLLCFSTFAQDTSRLRISLLTCAQGNQLYSTFGHSALRVIDSNAVTDNVYNYGTFNFYEKDFYIKFVKGKLKYYVDVEGFQDFQYGYILDNRPITEQLLNLSPQAKIEIRQALNENLKEENKYYLYNFFLDNCTTRLRDLLLKYQQPLPSLPPVMPTNSTFRDAVHQSHDSSHSPWLKLGMDIMLGVHADDVMTTEQQQFLPINLQKALAETKQNNLVLSTQNLFYVEPQKKSSFIFTPFVCFLSIFLLFIILQTIKSNFSINILVAMDSFLFFTVGILGTVLAILWAITDHVTLQNNYNLLWAWPTHIVLAFCVKSTSKRATTYRLLAAIFLILLLACWLFLAQQFNNALLPIIILLIWRLLSFSTLPTKQNG